MKNETRGKRLAESLHWNGLAILEVVRAALTEANFSSEAMQIETMIAHEKAYTSPSKLFKAIDNETGEHSTMNEAQVREEIYETMSHDMGTWANYSDKEIRQGAMCDNLDDIFDGDTFEGTNYTITK